MFPGFDRIIEQRIQNAQKEGAFDGLQGTGKPLDLTHDANVPEDLRLAYKMLKNADFVPEEIELKKKIRQTEDLLDGMPETSEKYRTLKKLNFLIMKLNTIRDGAVEFDMPQHYSDKLLDHLSPESPGDENR